MKTIDVGIICLTIVIVVLGIGFFLWSENISENPYELCLESCAVSDKITCTSICTQEFKEAIEIIVNKLAPLLEEIIKSEYALK